MARGDLDSLLEAPALEQVEAADRFLRLGERAVRDQLLAAANAHRAGAARRGELVADQPDALRTEVIDPGEALFELVGRRPRLRLRLAVHPLRVPADQQQVFHRRSSRGRFDLT